MIRCNKKCNKRLVIVWFESDKNYNKENINILNSNTKIIKK